jgi:hypothetical protein
VTNLIHILLIYVVEMSPLAKRCNLIITSLFAVYAVLALAAARAIKV